MRQATKDELHQISIDAARAVLHERNLGQMVEHATRRLVGERFADPVVAAAALDPLRPDITDLAETTARATATTTAGAMIDVVREDVELARAEVAGLAREATARTEAALGQARAEMEGLAREATAKAEAALAEARAEVTDLASAATTKADTAVAAARQEVIDLAAKATETAQHALAEAREEVQRLAGTASTVAQHAVGEARDEVRQVAADTQRAAGQAREELRQVAVGTQRAADEAREELGQLAESATAAAQRAVGELQGEARQVAADTQRAAGEVREELRQLADTATAAARHAVGEVRDEVRQFAETATAVAQRAAGEARDEVRQAAVGTQRAVSEAREELRRLAEHVTGMAQQATNDVRQLAGKAAEDAQRAVGGAQGELRRLVGEAGAKAAAVVEQARGEVVELAREAAEKAAAEYIPRPVEVSLPGGTRHQVTGFTHEVLPELVLALGARCHVLLVGPAGTGKSMLATHAAQALGLELQAISLGPTTPMSKVFGYYDAHGNYHGTPFRRAFEHGGVMLLDELDNGHPGLLAELNQALALGVCAFADAMVTAHPDFRLVATGNTYGTGGDRQYVGRQALDAATLDRFVTIDVAVDEKLEESVAFGLAPTKKQFVRELLTEVRRLREAAADKQLPVMFSPRVSYDGARLLAAGASLEQVLSWRVVRGLSAAHRATLGLQS